MVPVAGLLAALELEPVSDGLLRAQSVQVGHNVVFGGQLLAQSIIAGARGHEDKVVKTLHTVFARGARPDAPLDITVEPIQSGRAFASSSVTISQGGKTCVRSTVLLTTPEPDLIRHALPVGEQPEVPAAADGDEMTAVVLADIDDPALVGPPELDVWACFPGAPADPLLNQALLAFASDFYLIGTAMRPHAGVGQAQAHRSVATSVISHTVTFHTPFSIAEWLLLRHTSVFTGGGRAYGRADVFTTGGELVASYVQDSMIRAMAGATS